MSENPRNYRMRDNDALCNGAQARRRWQLCLEAVHLAAEVVAAYRHVQAANELLAALLLTCWCVSWVPLASGRLQKYSLVRRTKCSIRQENQPGARSPDRPSTGCKLAQCGELA